MTIENPEYDVAISFLASDEPIAAALYDELSRTLNVFFFPRNQEELAGTDGMESMRKPFLDGSRVTVVLYREQWGKTRWTAIEEAAIKEACFNGGWNRLFVIVLDRNSPLPKWLPDHHVRYNWEDFGADQAVGAIKARVLDNGGRPVALTPRKRAELLKVDDLYRMEKARIKSQEGIARILESVKELFREIEKQCDDVKSEYSLLQIKCEIEFGEGSVDQQCVLTDGRVGMIVLWRQPWANLLDDSGLFVQEYNRGLILPSARGRLIYSQPPKRIAETTYEPELSRARALGWKQRGKSPEFISSPALAERCVLQFIELLDRFASGKVGDESAF